MVSQQASFLFQEPHDFTNRDPIFRIRHASEFVYKMVTFAATSIYYIKIASLPTGHHRWAPKVGARTFIKAEGNPPGRANRLMVESDAVCSGLHECPDSKWLANPLSDNRASEGLSLATSPPITPPISWLLIPMGARIG